MKSRKSYYTTPSVCVGIGGSVGVSKMLKFLCLSFFYVMGYPVPVTGLVNNKKGIMYVHIRIASMRRF